MKEGSSLAPAAIIEPNPMAKAELNSALRQLRGSFGGLVFKQYRYGTVVTQAPRMAGIKSTPAQRAHRDRFRQAAQFHRTVLASPALKKRYAAVARKKGLPLSAVTFAAFMQQGVAVKPVADRERHPSA